MTEEFSIFRAYYENPVFFDRFSEGTFDTPVSVIIPVIHVNEFWRSNLLSIYREVPVAELLIGDGGASNETLAVLSEFPRVRILDQNRYRTLGYCLRHLIEATTTPHFIYFHSDVYLPEGWFDQMIPYREKYDWYGCRVRHTILVEQDHPNLEGRPYWGSQIGLREAFVEGLKYIEDDYVWRQEDFVLSEIVERAGYREGGIDNVFHYHQVVSKKSPVIDYSGLRATVSKTATEEEEIRVLTSQVKGIIKYMSPVKPWAVYSVGNGIHRMVSLNVWTRAEIFDWIAETSPRWVKPARGSYRKARLKGVLLSLKRALETTFRQLQSR